MQVHFGIDDIQYPVYQYIRIRQYHMDLDFKEITAKEITHAVLQQANNKASGSDLHILLKMCRRHYSLVKAIFNKGSSLGYFSRHWKRGIVVFFRKRNKSERSTRRYRPITLLSILGGNLYYLKG